MPLALACAWMTSGLASAAAPTLMLRQPAVSKDHLAFVYGGDLWLADRSGGRSSAARCAATSARAAENPP